jgi:fructose-bisphosphate aldolase class II
VLTTAEDVEDFAATGVDFLAPAFGNIHGEYGPNGPQLDFERYIWHTEANMHQQLTVSRLDNIRKTINGRMRVAMHGTNGFPEDVMKECIKRGVSKVNVNKLVLHDSLAYLRDNAATTTLTKLMEEGVEKAQRLAQWQMDVCGSAGKAK